MIYLYMTLIAITSGIIAASVVLWVQPKKKLRTKTTVTQPNPYEEKPMGKVVRRSDEVVAHEEQEDF